MQLGACLGGALQPLVVVREAQDLGPQQSDVSVQLCHIVSADDFLQPRQLLRQLHVLHCTAEGRSQSLSLP